MKRLALLIVFACGVAAEERIIAAAAHAPGANGTFWKTELRVFNPDAAEIEVEVSLLPEKGEAKKVRVAGRSAVRYGDVLAELFGSEGVAAMRLRSSAKFDATSRTFTTGECGSYGQFVPSVAIDSALQRGVLLHLAQDATSRTNVGFVNANDAVANVTLRPEGAAARRMAIAARSMVQNAYTGESMLAFEADVPVVAYASVVDNVSGDALFIAAVDDRGEGARVFDVKAQQFRFTVTPGGAETIHVRRGERVTLRIHSIDAMHGFVMPNIVPHQTLIGGEAPLEVTFVAENVGTFQFFCTIECGSGHLGMRGQMVVSE